MNKLILFFSIVVILLPACSERKKNSDSGLASNIVSIYVQYYNYSFNSVLSISCGDILKSKPENDSVPILGEDGTIEYIQDYQCVMDTSIVNITTLKDIEEELKSLKLDSLEYDIDARISCLIKYKDGTREYICIGGYLADDLIYNYLKVINPNKLLYLIKSNIGYYSWMNDDILKHSPELNDNSFQRISIESRSGNFY